MTVVCFCVGAALTAATGKARPVKLLLLALTGIFAISLVVGLIISRGLLVYLLFQVIALVIILYFVVIAGAVCGGGIYLLLHRRAPGQVVDPNELADYLSVADFANAEGVEPERLIARIKSGFYRGGRHAGVWYVHRSELSPPVDSAPVDVTTTGAIKTHAVRKGKLSL